MTEQQLIREKSRLIRNGTSPANQRARRLCLFAIEKGLDAVNPLKSVTSWLRISGRKLRVGKFSTPAPTRIAVLAVGKASLPMLSGALRILGRSVASGILVTGKTEGTIRLDKRIAVFRTGHPTPDAEGIRASLYVKAAIERMQPNELLLCLISGGASAMLPAPVHGITLEDKQKITQRLVRSRASIHQINTVRRHLSELKGGRLVEHCRAGRIVSLIISDVPRNSLADIGSGLTAPDPTTFEDAIKVLREFKLWDTAPASIRNHLRRGSCGRIPDTPKPDDRIFRKVRNVIIADNNTACETVRRSLNKRHIPTTILASSIEMEATDLGKLLASIAQESETLSGRVKRRGALVLGGETTVEVRGHGRGGRNQEVALAALERIAGLKGVAISTFGTDGIDGNSPAAGALVDGGSLARATLFGLHPRKFIVRNDSYNFFKKLGDCIVIGPTGTNVGDINLIVRVE